MSTSYRLCFAVGVPVSLLRDGKIVKRTVPRTKYREDTGAPYQVAKDSWFIKLTNGAEVETDSWSSGLNQAIEAYGIQVIGEAEMSHQTAGVILSEGEWDANAQCAVELPAIKAEDAQRAYDLLTKAGFPVAQSDIKVYAVLDVSY